MEIYRYTLVLVIGLTFWVGLQNFMVSLWKKSLSVHFWFASLVSLIAIHDSLWLIRSFISNPSVSHQINMIQWGLVWLTMATMAPFVETYLLGKIGLLTKINWIVGALFLLCDVALPSGGIYAQMPVVTCVLMPWGESFYSPDYQTHMTWLYLLEILWVAFSFVAFFARALMLEKKPRSFLMGRALTIGLGVMLVCIVYDTVLDTHWFPLPPIRLQHAGVIFMILGMNFSLAKEIHLATQIKDRLVSSELRLRLMTMNIPAILYRQNFADNGEIIFVSISGAIELVFGQHTTASNLLEVLNKGLAREDLERFTHLNEYVRNSKQPFEFEAKYNHPDGNPRWIRISSLPSQENGICYFTGIILDQTPQWKNDIERKKLTENLQRKTEEQESVFYATSHDLRSPLLNMSGFASEIRTELMEIKRLLSLPEPPPQEVLNEHIQALNEGMHFVDSSVARMSMLLDGLLMVNRSGRFPVDLQAVDPTSLLQKICDSVQHQIRQHGATVKVAQLHPCWADPNLLSQIFANLLDNALKYRHALRKPLIQIQSELTSAMVCYRISDNGQGFKQELAPLLFRLFHRLHPQGNVPGQGVGLTIVQRLLHRMGGSVEAKSVDGEGSVFTISLPAIPNLPA